MGVRTDILRVKNILVDKLLCDHCGSQMQWDGQVYTTYPPQYPYICPNCENRSVVDKTYPIYYLELSDGTMLQI